MLLNDCMKTKTCSICNIELTLDKFYKSKGHKYGKGSYCKLCDKKRGRVTHLRITYNLTIEKYEKMLKSQNGVCDICKLPELSGILLCVDHDHKTGRIRGLLCKKCNSVLGLISEKLDTLQNIHSYLNKHREYKKCF